MGRPSAAIRSALLVTALVVGGGLAMARPGGGHGYSGGGDSGGGGGSSGGGELLFFILRIWLNIVIRYPAFGVPATIVAILLFLAVKRARSQDWDVGAAPPTTRAKDLDAIRARDPEFSTVLFEDFAYALYGRAHRARTRAADMEALAGYLQDPARRDLTQRSPSGVAVRAAIVGAMRPIDLTLPLQASGAPTRVTLDFEANLVYADGTTLQYVREHWAFSRAASVQSRPRDDVQGFGCPSCGAPLTTTADMRCQHCGNVVAGGRFDWVVQSVKLLSVAARPPVLKGTVRERGTDFPTIYHPKLADRRARLLESDPSLTEAALGQRLSLVYDELNQAWTQLELKSVRPYVSDGLFDYLQYWIEAYKAQELRNVLEGLRMTKTAFVKVVSDKHYDAVTFRIWGQGRDSTIEVASGKLVGGNPRVDRRYTEYWTLIRGSKARGAPRTDKSCPNCGAALQVNMAGNCEFCGARLTRGEFDWVLSKIEQDDSYSG